MNNQKLNQNNGRFPRQLGKTNMLKDSIDSQIRESAPEEDEFITTTHGTRIRIPGDDELKPTPYAVLRDTSEPKTIANADLIDTPFQDIPVRELTDEEKEQCRKEVEEVYTPEILSGCLFAELVASRKSLRDTIEDSKTTWFQVQRLKQLKALYPNNPMLQQDFFNPDNKDFNVEAFIKEYPLDIFKLEYAIELFTKEIEKYSEQAKSVKFLTEEMIKASEKKIEGIKNNPNIPDVEKTKLIKIQERTIEGYKDRVEMSRLKEKCDIESPKFRKEVAKLYKQGYDDAISRAIDLAHEFTEMQFSVIEDFLNSRYYAPKIASVILLYMAEKIKVSYAQGLHVNYKFFLLNILDYVSSKSGDTVFDLASEEEMLSSIDEVVANFVVAINNINK